jgi:hypothetical protein
MKKIIFLLVIIILGFGIYYLLSGNNKHSFVSQNIAELTSADKAKIASIIYEGEQTLRSGDAKEIRKLFQDANPKNSMLNLPDSALISLSKLAQKSRSVTKEEILNYSKWSLENNIVSIIVDKGDGTETVVRAILRDGVWYHY